MNLKILLATACGEKKRPGKHRAVDLYYSSRIKAVYNRRSGCDMAILSARYGLVDSEKVIAYYQEVMNSKRAEILLPQVVNYLRKYDVSVYFRTGARAVYYELMKKASRIANKTIICFGSGYMKGINKIPEVISTIQKDSKFLNKYQSNKIKIDSIYSKIESTRPVDEAQITLKTDKIPNSDDFRREILKIFEKAKKEKKEFVEIIAGELHRKIGYYPGPNHRMYSLCNVMRDLLQPGDEILNQPKKGRGPRLQICYSLNIR